MCAVLLSCGVSLENAFALLFAISTLSGPVGFRGLCRITWVHRQWFESHGPSGDT